jgi:hypothetical protein
MHGERIADAGIRESGGKDQCDKNEKNPSGRTGESKNHPAILCIDKLLDARRKSGEKCETPGASQTRKLALLAYGGRERFVGAAAAADIDTQALDLLV